MCHLFHKKDDSNRIGHIRSIFFEMQFYITLCLEGEHMYRYKLHTFIYSLTLKRHENISVYFKSNIF